MTSRRDFLKAGLAATALPIAARADIVTPDARASVSLYKVLYDTRFPAGVAFARGAAARGVAVHAMAGDMTRFWYDDLYHRWQHEPAAIAGLTAEGALFCLERLAWDQRMRVVYRGRHVAAPDGCIAHRFEGPEPLLPAAVEATASAAWAAELAGVIGNCPRGRAEKGTAESVTRSVAAPPEVLFSWVIASVAHRGV